jgi:hypothetical protein
MPSDSSSPFGTSRSARDRTALPEAAEDERPAVLGVRFGVNPNSSSLGVDVSFLLFGGTAAVAASLVLSAWLRGYKRKAKLVGEPPAAPYDLNAAPQS